MSYESHRESTGFLRAFHSRRLSVLPISLASLVAVTALLATSCGDPSSEERFAEKVCSTIVPRAREMLEVYDDVIHARAAPGRAARITLLTFTLDGREIAINLYRELETLSVPDTDAGREAESYVEYLGRFAVNVMSAEERRVRRLPETITLVQSIRGLNRLELAVFNAYGQMIGYDIIGVRVPELTKPFERADSCQQLEALRVKNRSQYG